jgi:hypothetical protein
VTLLVAAWGCGTSGESRAAVTGGPISVDGVPDRLGIVDPDAYRVGDRIRLACLANVTSQGERAICLVRGWQVVPHAGPG